MIFQHTTGNKNMTLVVATFYKFIQLPDFVEMQNPLLTFCQGEGIKGTILLAPEGINGTVAASRDRILALFSFLRSDRRLVDLEYRESPAQKEPFERMKVKLKKEIVTLGLPEVNPSEKTGIYVSPQDWNQVISDPDVVVIDTRNHYEVNIGTFKGAINPNTESFSDFPEYVHQQLDPKKHQKVAMFCTGGIRCEKASAYMLSQGFSEVYHLQGGILKYLEDIPPEESMWEGECFVFDERVAVNHGLTVGSHDMCIGCGHPISDEDKASPQYEAGISCPYCFSTLTEEKRQRLTSRRRQQDL
jgi:UPF0176 protein